MLDLFLDIGNDLAGIGLVPVPVQLLGGDTELDNEVARQILRLGLAPFFPPQPDQGAFVVAHNDPGIRSANEIATVFPNLCHRQLLLTAKVAFMLFRAE